MLKTVSLFSLQKPQNNEKTQTL